VALRDVGLALSAAHRPWTDLRAVKTTQVDIVKAVADQTHEAAALRQEIARLNGRVAEQEAAIRALRALIESRPDKGKPPYEPGTIVMAAAKSGE
jgi:hypothetical protein